MKALVVGGSGATGIPIIEGLAHRQYDVTILHRGVHEPPEIQMFKHIHADPHFSSSVSEAIGNLKFDLVVLTYGRLEQLAPLFAHRCERLIAIGGIPIYAGLIEPGSVHPPGMKIMARESSLLAIETPLENPRAAAFVRKMTTAEQAVMKLHGDGAYSATIIRYPHIYGPRQLSLIDWSIIKRVQDGRPFILLPNSGLGIMSRCAAENAAACILLSLDQESSEGEVFNCADEDQYTLGNWIQMILDELGSSASLIPLLPRQNWVAEHLLGHLGGVSAHALVDASKSRMLLGYRDKITAKTALQRLIHWRLRNPPDKMSVQNWPDEFDYSLEDRVRDGLEKFNDGLPPVRSMKKCPSISAPERA